MKHQQLTNIATRCADLNSPRKSGDAVRVMPRWIGYECLPVLLLCLLLTVAWRHGLSQSPWIQARFVQVDPIREETLPNPMLHQSQEPRFQAEVSAGQSKQQAISQEQQRLVDFIVQRYRAASDVVHAVVAETYSIAKEQRIDPFLILAMVAVESQFDPLAQSPRGAQGLMQILTRVHAARFERLGGVAAVFDPVSNLRVGVGILKEYLGRDESLEQALKTYVGAANLPSDHGYGQKVMLARSKLEAVAKTPAPQQ